MTTEDVERLIRAVCGLRLPKYELRTLVALATLISPETGLADPAVNRLVDLVNIDKRNLCRALRSLQRRGLVAIERQGGAARRTNRYAVIPPTEVAMA